MNQDMTSTANKPRDESTWSTSAPDAYRSQAGDPSAKRAPATTWLPQESGAIERAQTRRGSFRVAMAAIAVGGMVMFSSLAWMAVTRQGTQPVPGPLLADHNTHRIESFESDMPAPSVRFLLQARGAPLVSEVTTDQQCASARLVQGGQTSSWFGFSHPSRQFAGVQMLPFQPAYLEVRIDPKIHGLDREVDVYHDVLVKTADGQVLNFDVVTGGR